MTNPIFSDVQRAPSDPILGVNEAFNADLRTTKVNLGVGVYYNELGKIPVLRAVQAVEKSRAEAVLPKEYQPIEGSATYRQAVQHLLFGVEHPLVQSKRIVTVQALGGTGALRIGADFLYRFHKNAKVYISNPSWENHRALFEAAGFTVEAYPYYDKAIHGVNVASMLGFLEALSPGAIIVLHACCHNPTGADLAAEHWSQVAQVCQERGLIPFIDVAYQGFANSIAEDTYALRVFADAGRPFFIANSFSKNFSLYGERVGTLLIVTASQDEAERVLSQLKRIIRTHYSSPPIHGAALVSTILTSAELYQMWEAELAGMRSRIRDMRSGLVHAIQAAGITQDLSFITCQRGMFSYTGLTARQVEHLRSEFGIYAVSTGRVCLAALNDQNLDYVAAAIVKVLSAYTAM